MTVARGIAAAILVGLALWQPVSAQSTGRGASAETPLAGQAGASVAPPPAPAVEEIVIDPTATVVPQTAVPKPQGIRRANVRRPARVTAATQPRAPSQVTAATRVEVLRLDRPVPSTALPDDTRVVPLHVARKRARIGSFRVPSGYRPAWEDDRLNPRRAEGTLGGRETMNDVWTSTVPRRLIDPAGGRARKPKPAIVYPTLPGTRSDPGTSTLATRQGGATGESRFQGAGVGR